MSDLIVTANDIAEVLQKHRLRAINADGCESCRQEIGEQRDSESVAAYLDLIVDVEGVQRAVDWLLDNPGPRVLRTS